MNRLLFIIIAWLSTLTALAQTEGYDPSNPPLPNFPTTGSDTTHYYTLRVVSSPLTSGLNTTGGDKYTAGQRVYLSAGQSNGMKFQYWVDGEGNTLSTSTSFYYTMPAHNVVITAVYKYQPANPSLPAFPEGETPTYLLSLSTRPAGAGSFSGGGRPYEAGANVSLYAYTNTNFEFVCWTNATGDTLSTARNLYYTMPAAPAQLYGHYRYNPSSPNNPGRNAYDADEGTAIIDDFTPGSASQAIYDVTGGNTSSLSKIIVAGTVTNNDFQIANNYGTCATIDLSRTYGVNTVPGSCWYGNDHLTRIMLPSCITRIGSYAFYNATALAELTCLATTPPALDSYVFEGVNKGLIVFVPKASVEIYEQAEGWKDYVSNGTLIIMPVQHNVASLEVNLPEVCADGRYKNMPLELINVKTGQRYRYVVTDRINYTFNTLMRDTRYVAVLRNQQGTELARTDTVKIELESQSISFNPDRMKQLRTVSATITAGATDITAQATVNWLDANGNYLAQGTELANQVAGTQVKCAVSVPQSVAMQYALPADTLYQVIEADNPLHITLQPLPALTLTGRVIDRATQQGMSGVTVTMSQTLNGRYTKAITARTDQRGQYTLSGYSAPSVLTYALTDYVSRTDTLPDSLMAATTAQLPDVLLKPIQGARITTIYSYTTSVAQGVQPEVKDYYDDYQNVSYTIYNQTAQRAITHFNVQYPDIVLLEDVNEGDSLTITARSKTDAFMPVATGGRISSDLALTIEVPVTQLGGIRAVYTTTENPTVLAILYDAQGNLLGRYTYPAASLTISGLKDGEYTLVTMGQSDFFNSVYNLSQFDQAGLINGTDYVANRVTVRSGLIVPVKNAVVPYFDESKFYYTGANTSFAANKSSIVAGNYLTLTAKVDFKSVYRDNVSGVQLQIELPEGTNMVDGSLMIGSAVSYYQLKGRTITVPLDNSHITDRVRFCVIPTQSGTFAPSAAVAFRLKGKDMVQPIGSAQYNVQDVAINVPSEVNTPHIIISGVASGRSDIVVYANSEILGTTRALANGYWQIESELLTPYNLQRYNIYADIKSASGLLTKTRSQECIYNKEKIVAKSVDMSFYNAYLRKNIAVTFDLEKQTNDGESYMFYTGTDITFAANLSNNDTTIVKGVTIGVYTDRNEWQYLEAKYMPAIDRWTAVKRFESNNLPIGVKVDIDADYEAIIDENEMKAIANNADFMTTPFTNIFNAIEALNSDSLSPQDYITGMAQIEPEFEYSYKFDNYTDFSDEELSQALLAFTNEDDAAIIDSISTSINELKAYFSDDIYFTKQLPDGTLITTSKCLEVNADSLINEGYEVYKTTEGYIYASRSGNNSDLINPQLNLRITITKPNDANLISAKKISPENFLNKFNEMVETIMEYYNPIAEAYQKVEEKIGVFSKAFESLLKEVNQKITQDQTRFNMKAVKLSRLEKELANMNPLNIDYVIKQAEIKEYRKEVEQAKQILNASLRKKALVTSAIRLTRPLPGIFKKSIPLSKYADGIYDAVNTVRKFQQVYQSIPDPCDNDQQEADKCKYLCIASASDMVGFAGVKLQAKALLDLATIEQLAAAPISGGATVASALTTMIINIAGSIALDKIYNFGTKKLITGLKRKIAALKCVEKCPKCHKKPCECNIPCKQCGHNPCTCQPRPTKQPIHDPSGYVYEGVSSNRLQGVTATCYYKETVEDMYGDLHENIVLWDAEEYAQQNPLFTDENGMYQWDVPQGLWQVRFEKEGYQPTQSEWLPVPPPQMDVNIGMVQNAQPEVVSARAYEDGVELQFSKYMDPATLTPDNIYLKCKTGNTEVLVNDAQIELLNAEPAIEGSEQQYASRLRLATDRLGYYDEARIIVSRNVQSYAGIGMTSNFEQQLDVEKKVRQIVVDSVINIAYNAQLTINVAAQPAEAAAGKTITLGSASALIAATDATELTLDADGHATFTINAQLPGATAINYAMPDANIKATTMVNVVDPALLNAVKAPRASRLSGTAVYRGQTIALTTESEGAAIYYTTDGSCPCDAATRIKYERPIVITGPVTIKAMAIGINADESDVETFDYTIRQSNVKLLLAEGWNWSSHDLAAPLATTALSSVATRIVTQEREAIADPDLGLVGNLLSINAAETMKLLAPATAEKAFAGEQYNPTATQIELSRGWNWLGYPLGTSLALNDALALLEPDTDDCIETLDGGFATYTADGEWAGSLQLMQPGRGYLYKSGSDKSFAYNAQSSVANAQALYGPHRLQAKAAPYELNRHRYPNMMPVVATLSGGTLSQGSQVVALSDGECRGIANIEADGMIYLSVYGLGNETINFVAFDAATCEALPISNTTAFTADMLGTTGAPYVLHLDGTATGINGNVTSQSALPNGIYTVGGQRLDRVTQPGLYIIKTTTLDGRTTVRKQVVK